MRLSGKSILGICLVLFGGYAIYDYWKDDQNSKKKLTDSRLVHLQLDQINQLEIEREDFKMILSRDESGWKLVEPVQDLADVGNVEDFIKSTVNESISDVAKEGPVDFAVYGLAQPLGKLTLRNTAGESETFAVSEKVNFEDKAFLRKNDESRVLVVGSLWQNRVQKGVMDFREARLLRSNLAKVDELKLRNKSGEFLIQRVNGQWIAPRSKDVVLDQNKVRELLTDIADSRADDIQPGTLKKSGLKRLITIDMKLDEVKWSALVEQDKDFKIYAKVSEPSFWLRMEPGALDRFIEFRLKDLEVDPPATENDATAPDGADDTDAE